MRGPAGHEREPDGATGPPEAAPAHESAAAEAASGAAAAATGGAADPSPAGAAAAAPRGVLGFSPIQRLLITAAAVAITVLFMRIAVGVLVPILLAAVVTMAVSPFLAFLIRHRVPSLLAWLVTVILTTAAVVFVFVLCGIGIARLLGELASYTDDLTARLNQVVDGLNHIGLHVSGLTSGDKAVLGPERIINFGINIAQMARRVLGAVGLTLLIVFFMLAESITLRLKFSRTPPQVSPVIDRVELFTRDMRAFVQATALIGLINGIAAGVFLWLLGIDFPVMWGVLAFIMSFIPTLGFFIAVLPPLFIALLQAGWQSALLVLVGYIVIYAFTGSMRSGRFVGRRLNLSPLVILLSIIFWGWVLGLMGGLLAVPMTLFVRRMFLEASDESRWITDLLGRPVPAADGAGPPKGGQDGPGPPKGEQGGVEAREAEAGAPGSAG